MILNLSDVEVVLLCLSVSGFKELCNKHRFDGGSVGADCRYLSKCLSRLENRLESFISEADVEANCQGPVADFTKRTVSDLDQRSAGDEVSLDQHIQLYREVF